MNDDNLVIAIATSMDLKIQCYLVRAIVYMEEQAYSYNEEFDGNDELSSHIIVTVNAEPVGTMRIRYFGSFVKFERAAIRKAYRGRNIGLRMESFAADFVARKGFNVCYATVETALAEHWEAAGFMQMHKPTSHISGCEFVPMSRRITPPIGQDTLTITTDDHVLMKQEGTWDNPSLATRAAIPKFSTTTRAAG